jgi:hypothetical protein
MIGERRAQRDRRGIMNRAMEDASRSQRQTIDTVLAEAQSLAPEARMRAMDAAEGTVGTQLQQDMAGAGGLTSPVAGRRSDAYSDALMTREAGEQDRTGALMRELAKVRAPGNVLMDESLRRGSMAEALNSLWSTTRNRNRAAGMDADAVQAPWWGQVAGMGNRISSGVLRGMSGGMF